MTDSKCGPPEDAGLPVPLTRRDFARGIAVAVGGALYSRAEAATRADPHVAQPQASKASTEEIMFISATELSARIRKKQISAREVMTAHLAQIERINPKVNAIVTLVADQAMADAARADEILARSGPVGVLHGLPVAVDERAAVHVDNNRALTPGDLGLIDIRLYLQRADPLVGVSLNLGR